MSDSPASAEAGVEDETTDHVCLQEHEQGLREPDAALVGLLPRLLQRVRCRYVPELLQRLRVLQQVLHGLCHLQALLHPVRRVQRLLLLVRHLQGLLPWMRHLRMLPVLRVSVASLGF